MPVKTFIGRIQQKLPVIRARIHLPELKAHATLDFVISTGSPRTIISARDAGYTGAALHALHQQPSYTLTDQFGNTFDVVDARASVTYYNAEGQTHQCWVTAAIRKSDPDHPPSRDIAATDATSILAPDALRDVTLTIRSGPESAVTLTA